MRGKRAKKYRKLMEQYSRSFNFREPYQVLVDAQMLHDTYRFKMDLIKSLSRILQGTVKPMITNCSIRHLFSSTESFSPASLSQADKTALLNLSRTTLDLRRCNHHTLPEPLSTLECYQSIIDPKSSGTNKHRYILASQHENVRRWARSVRGLPIVFVKRSVMVLEPMADVSLEVKEGVEKQKLRGGVRTGGKEGKRKRTEEKDQAEGDKEEREVKKRKTYGPKAPNPLSTKKKKKKKKVRVEESSEAKTGGLDAPGAEAEGIVTAPNQSAENEIKRKRRRKHKVTGEVIASKVGLST